MPSWGWLSAVGISASAGDARWELLHIHVLINHSFGQVCKSRPIATTGWRLSFGLAARLRRHCVSVGGCAKAGRSMLHLLFCSGVGRWAWRSGSPRALGARLGRPIVEPPLRFAVAERVLMVDAGARSCCGGVARCGQVAFALAGHVAATC